MASAAATAGAPGALPVMSAPAHADTGGLPSLWDVDRSVVKLENAYWGVMPRSVEEEYARQTRYLNRHNITFVRDGIPGHERTVAMDHVRAEVAQLMGASKEEFTLTRNGTEAMQNLILQYGSLRPGDAVMYADLDYDEMQQAMDSLTRRRGVTEDGDAAAQETPCSHGRTHRYGAGQRCPSHPHAVQHAPRTRPSGGGAPSGKWRLHVMPLPHESAQPEGGWSSPSAASAAESLPRLVMPRRG
ncbi:aminotransferase class V-fold PLP-dependent enzyme [Streptomyces sp. NPDC048171]|uniref:aminotransferase class V-fold PLP-dependent enzyme n=1 Tax=unclassified Streptomyces TaxID=2593676 RepID=UPI00136B347E|nr:aminotransferase class V-fold PLP-dependent enzyme [Streptomyces sp. SID5789]MZE72374.1 aminotransferase class V-fold PLP-dependent enzyme [Streptomyces sp. SID5789]